MSNAWVAQGDEVALVTSNDALSRVAMISDDSEVMATWITLMSQLRPSNAQRFPVEVHPDDRAYAEELVGLGLLLRSEEDVDAYLVPRSIAYADYAANAFRNRLH